MRTTVRRAEEESPGEEESEPREAGGIWKDKRAIDKQAFLSSRPAGRSFGGGETPKRPKEAFSLKGFHVSKGEEKKEEKGETRHLAKTSFFS